MFTDRIRQLLRLTRSAARKPQRQPRRWRPCLEGLESRLAPAGDFGFALDLGGSGASVGGKAAATDAAGNVYITGTFSGTVDFDPGPGVSNLTAKGFDDIFVAKYTAAGALAWVRQFAEAPQLSTTVGGIAVDGAGNVLVSGRFVGTVDFDPGPGTFNLTAVGIGDPFVAKLDSGGNFVWAKQFAASNTSGGGDANAVAVDGAGNVYSTGTFFGTVDFDPGPGTHNLTSTGGSGPSGLSAANPFVAKLDSGGNFVWADQFSTSGSGSGGQPNALTVDGAGNVYTTGYFFGTVNFNPAGTANLTEAGTGSDIFVSKLSTAGQFVWAKQFAETGGNFGHGQGIAVDGSGNVYTTGSFQGTADFDPGPGTANLVTADRPATVTGPEQSAIFVSKLDGGGNFVWAKQFAGGGGDVGYGVALIGSANVYFAGSFSGTAAFASTSLTAAGLGDGFVARLDGTGNLVWVRQFANSGGSNSSVSLTGLAVNNAGDVYTTGSFAGTVDFDPGPGTHNLTSVGSRDAFVSQLLDTPTPATAPKTVYVNPAWANVPAGTDPDGSGPATAMGVDAFATAQPAIDAVAPGGTVNLAAGTYSGGLNLNKSVILQGAGSATTILSGPGSGTGLNITGHGDVVNGLTVKGFANGVIAGSGTVYLALTDVRLNGDGFGGVITGAQVVLIAGGSGDDTFFVTPGRLAHAGDNPVGFSGVQFLTVDGGGGSNDRLVVFLNDISTPAKVWVNGNGIARDTNPFLLFYRDSGGALGGGVAVVLGDGPETVVVQGQLTGAPTTIYGEGGDDIFDVAVTASSAYTNLTLDGGPGNDSLAVFDTSGGASMKNVVTVIGEGQIQVTYAGGSASTILYQNLEQILGGL
jgi:hypothetical protein